MFTKLKNREEGFTIIEVLIVLAIAGLIMLIVFLAVPALQRNQRNNARNSEAARVAGLVTECLSNRNGQTGSCNTAAEVQFDAASFGQLTNLNIADNIFSPLTYNTTTVGVVYGVVCDAEADGVTGTGATTRSFAVLFHLEPAVIRCING